MPLPLSEWPVIASALGLALLLTPVVSHCARRWGAVAQPRADRWHKRPTALLGGIAIFLAVAVPITAFGSLSREDAGWVIGAIVMFIAGLVDDLRRIRPAIKLLGQIIAVGAVLICGQRLSWTGYAVVDTAVTGFWLVGITNAMNLIDNMDGLATGVGAIAAAFFAGYFSSHGQTSESVRMLILAAALVGFLVYNSNPASIFMGDSGSQLIGFYLASAALYVHPSNGVTRWAAIGVPILILAVPIFDTSFVTITRIFAGRPISQGGRDHTSHRLVAKGLTERSAVCLLCAIGSVFGSLSLMLDMFTFSLQIGIVFSTLMFFLWFGRWCDKGYTP